MIWPQVVGIWSLLSDGSGGGLMLWAVIKLIRFFALLKGGSPVSSVKNVPPIA